MNDEIRMRRAFRPGLLPTLATLALLPVLVGLGLWQLGRYDYKQALWESFRSPGETEMPAAGVTGADDQRFRLVSARGQYLGDRQFLIDNMVRQGRNGFYVLTPLQLADGDLLLVNRGWIPQDGLRRPLGELEVSGEDRRVRGRVGALPVAGIKLDGEGSPEVSSWPSIRQFPDIDELAAALDAPVKPWVLLLAPDDGDGFVREWEPGGLPPSTHLGYAVQWFGLATALVVIYVLVNLKKTPISEQP